MRNLFAAENINLMEACIVLMAMAGDTFIDDDSDDTYMEDPWSWSLEEYKEDCEIIGTYMGRSYNNEAFLEIIMEKVNDIFIDNELTYAGVFVVIGDLFNIAFWRLEPDMPEALHNKLYDDLKMQGFDIW
jgi:hypothetical protein